MPARISIEDLVELLGVRSRPDTSWISKVTGCPIDSAESAVDDITRHARAIVGMTEGIKRTGREYYAQFPAPIDLYALVRLTRPRDVVESGVASGVASGVSSTFLLLGIEDNSFGALHSIDLPVTRQAARGGEPWAIPPRKSSGWAIPSKLKQSWDLRVGRSEELLKPLLREVGTLDFYCHDSPVDARHFEFEMRAITDCLAPGALVVADNTEWEVFDKTARAVGAKAFRRKQSSLAAFRVPSSRKQQGVPAMRTTAA